MLKNRYPYNLRRGYYLPLASMMLGIVVWLLEAFGVVSADFKFTGVWLVVVGWFLFLDMRLDAIETQLRDLRQLSTYTAWLAEKRKKTDDV